jgi:hypothetical protein
MAGRFVMPAALLILGGTSKEQSAPTSEENVNA